MSAADPNPLSTGWLLGQIKRNFNPPKASIGIHLPEPLGCQPSMQSKPSRKPLQPTHWECHCMIACTHHAAFWCVFFFGKKAEVLLSDWAWQTAGFFLVHRIPGAIYVGFKCTDRSRWSLATVTSGHSHGWTQPWSHRNCGISAITSLPLSDVLSLIGYLGQNYPCKHCVSLLVCRTDMSLQSQEPQLQSVVRNGALA